MEGFYLFRPANAVSQHGDPCTTPVLVLFRTFWNFRVLWIISKEHIYEASYAWERWIATQGCTKNISICIYAHLAYLLFCFLLHQVTSKSTLRRDTEEVAACVLNLILLDAYTHVRFNCWNPWFSWNHSIFLSSNTNTHQCMLSWLCASIQCLCLSRWAYGLFYFIHFIELGM